LPTRRGAKPDSHPLEWQLASLHGQTEPPSFVAATAELASIADAGEASRPSTGVGAEDIVSKKIDASYCSGPHSAWIKTKNSASIAMQRERNENWHRR
jgi:hypothetical protein